MSRLGHDAAEETEEAFLAAYMQNDYPKPSVALDLCVFTVSDGDLKVLLVERKGHPFKGCWAFPGGFLDIEKGETLQEGAGRELLEETSLDHLYYEQLYTFGGPGRDPRGYVVSVAWLALAPYGKVAQTQAGDDAAQAKWMSIYHPLPQLAFDHEDIFQIALARLRGKIDYSSIAFELLPPTFTINELRSVHKAIKGSTYEVHRFRRKVKRMLEDGVMEEAPGQRLTQGRPAKVYRFRRA